MSPSGRAPPRLFVPPPSAQAPTFKPHLTLCPDPSLTSLYAHCVLFTVWYKVTSHFINFLCLIRQRTSPKQLQNTWKFTDKNINNKLGAPLEPPGNVHGGSREGTISWKASVIHKITQSWTVTISLNISSTLFILPGWSNPILK